MPRGNGTGAGGQGSGRGSGQGQSGMGNMGGNRPGRGAGGYCVCPNCGEKVPHQRRNPCFDIDCPKCSSKMIRE